MEELPKMNAKALLFGRTFLKNRSTEFVPVCIFCVIVGPAAGFVAKRERWSRGDRKASKTTKLHKDY